MNGKEIPGQDSNGPLTPLPEIRARSFETTRPKILIVDDRKENLVTLRQVLKDIDAEIVEAATGNEALAATLDHDFALAVLDVQMPGMDGYELAGLLRGDPRTGRLPIIFLTAAYGEEEQVFKGYEAGAVDYIVKPYNPAVLISKVKVFLELHRTNADLARKVEALAAANKDLESFSYSVSHDLRAPLRTIEGFSRFLLEDYADALDATARDYLDHISAGTRKMSELIDAMLVLSRISRQEMSLQEVDLSGMAHSFVAELRNAHPQRSIDVTILESLRTQGDVRLLSVAISNLIRNAWKYTGKTENPCIEFGSLERNGERIFFVRDNGAGFNMDHAENLFAPFRRLHSESQFPGTGIGLAIVNRAVKRHGGKIWAEAEVEKGATFYFTLG